MSSNKEIQDQLSSYIFSGKFHEIERMVDSVQNKNEARRLLILFSEEPFFTYQYPLFTPFFFFLHKEKYQAQTVTVGDLDFLDAYYLPNYHLSDKTSRLAKKICILIAKYDLSLDVAVYFLSKKTNANLSLVFVGTLLAYQLLIENKKAVVQLIDSFYDSGNSFSKRSQSIFEFQGNNACALHYHELLDIIKNTEKRFS